MDFGAAAAASQQNGGLSFFDGGSTAAEISSALQTMPRLGADAAPSAEEEVEAGAPQPEKKGKSRVAETTGNQAASATAVAAAPAVPAPVAQQPRRFVDFSSQRLELGSDSCSSSSSGSSSGSGSGSSMLALAQKSTRTAKNGREQQRAQKISDVIDQLKVTLDKASFSEGSSSKLHVLVSCESYLRSLKDKIQCYEMETKLREAARGHGQQQASRPDGDSQATSTCAPGAPGASPRIRNTVEKWAANNSTAAGREQRPTSTNPSTAGSTRSGATDRMDTGEESCSGSGSSARGRPRRKSKKQALYAASSSSSDDDNSVGGSSSSGGGSGVGGGVLGISGVAPRGEGSGGGSTSSSAADNSSSTGSDGDAASSDSGGGSTSAGTTDSGSQGFTTDTTSRGFTTDSSFSGYTGSLFSGSGDAGSADGGSDESEEGTAGSRMRVVNYFDIFRLSNVPMAIANKSGALVDVNDAMRGFGRINQDTVKTLTVGSLVAPESAKALQEAMSKMLAVSTVPQDNPLSPQPAGAQPFLANAGIGNRPTLLTVSLVYDEGGEANAFHVALIPRSGGNSGGGGAGGGGGGQASVAARNSTE
ncbi:unnamed protein product, partial [Scytosiphon promiscuus]